MFYNLEEYEDAVTEIEVATLLADLDIDLIQTNIGEQINNLDNNINYLESIEDKYKLILEEFSDDIDSCIVAKNKIIMIYEFIINEIQESFDIDIDYQNMNFEQLSQAAGSLYNFLVIKARKNITKFYYKYIVANKKSLVQEYASEKRKDVTTSTIKKLTKNKDDIIILSKCPSIMSMLTNNIDFSTELFLDIAVGTEFNGIYVKDLIENDKVFGDIFYKYESMIRDDLDLYDDIYGRVYTKLYNKLIKKNTK